MKFREDLEQMKDQIILYNKQGWSDAQIADHLQSPYKSVDYVRRKMGLPSAGRGSWRIHGVKSRLDEIHNEILVWYHAKESDGEISRRLHCSSATVRNWRLKHNLPALCGEGAQPGIKNTSWKGGRIIDKSGYVLLHLPDHIQSNAHGYIREHRLVMEQRIGRRLRRNEVVHHINGKKDDNRIENLQLFSSNAKHLRKELKGKCPKWTEDGKRRILAAVSKARKGSKASLETRHKQSVAHRARWDELRIKNADQIKEREETVRYWHSKGLNDPEIGEKIDRTREIARIVRVRLGLPPHPQKNSRRQKPQSQSPEKKEQPSPF